MRVIEASGSPVEMGHATGEALRDEIRERIERFPSLRPTAAFRERLPRFVDTLERRLPEVLEEIRATAAGANLGFIDIAALNLPMYANDLDLDECSNVVFANGPDGPVWGKNNDGNSSDLTKQQNVCCRVIRPCAGIPQITFTFCGTVGFADAMNAEGLAMGHSSVGSVFQQSDHHVPVRLWAHWGLFKCRTTAEFARHMASRPLRGKGYSWVAVDRAGKAVSLEIPCPLTQVRQSTHPNGHVHCVNLYQLPCLHAADRRVPKYKVLAVARWKMLDAKLDDTHGTWDTAHMQNILRWHGDGTPSMCRHGGEDLSHTEYSMIALPAAGKMFYCHGHPCECDYAEVRF